MKYMPKMTLVITNVQTDITSHAGTTGQAIVDRTNHKNHQVKQALWRLKKAGTITETPQGNGRWYVNTYTIV